MDARQNLKKYFGYDSFREGQEKIINAILAGRDALAIMPTGAGNLLSNSCCDVAWDYVGNFTADITDDGSGQGFE